jgi:hypothetical protein
MISVALLLSRQECRDASFAAEAATRRSALRLLVSDRSSDLSSERHTSPDNRLCSSAVARATIALASDDALVGVVLPLASAAARKDARVGGRELLLYASCSHGDLVTAPLAERWRDGRRRRDPEALAASDVLASVERVAGLVADPPGEIPPSRRCAELGTAEAPSGCGRARIRGRLGTVARVRISPRSCEKLANTLCATPAGALPLIIEPGTCAAPARGGGWLTATGRTPSAPREGTPASVSIVEG